MTLLRRHAWLALLLAVFLVLTACGDSESDETSAPTTEAAETGGDDAGDDGDAMADAGEVVIVSTQAAPVEEAEAFQDQVLAGFSGTAEFLPGEETDMITRVEAELGSSGSVDVLMALHGTFPTLQEQGALADLSDVAAELSAAGIPDAFLELGRLGTDTQYYIPVMQATYMMAASNDSLALLPGGADVNALTWDQLNEWSTAIAADAGAERLGIPAADDGLLHRFLQGYLYPSWTGGMVTNFRTAEAEAMWAYMVGLWETANPQSTSYAFMQEPLLAGEVAVGFDHQARLKDAFDTSPDDFVAFPAPTGPAGLGFMPVIVGLAIPENAPNVDGAKEMIRFLMKDESQVAITNAIGFFPATAAAMPADASPSVTAEGAAVSAQAASADALPALLPVGLGERGGEFNKIYRDTFTRIVINGEDIPTVLAEEGDKLQTLLNETGAPCWAPDPPSDGACQLN